MRALVRPVSDSFAGFLVTYIERRPVDVERARTQHAAYVSLLRDLGCDVTWLDPLHDSPDAVFVEDTAVVAPPIAVLTRPGAAVRRGEVASVRGSLAAARRLVTALGSGRLDGGDVLLIDRVLYVGMTDRTDTEGRAALARAVAPYGYHVVPVAVDGVLHLKTAVTALRDGTLVAAVDHVDLAPFGQAEVVPAAERSGADVLVVNDAVVVASSAPRTAALIAERGLDVRTVDISELEAAEAGVTCMSILDPRPGT